MLTALVACAQDRGTYDPAPKVRTVETSWAFDKADQRALAGWADAIFVGTVAEKSGTESRIPSLPESQFRVTVLETLKGELPESVTVNQQGGFLPERNELVLIEDDPLLSVGKSYLFATRHAPDKNWYTVSSRVGDVELTPMELQGVQSALRTGATEPEKIQKMRESITQEIPPGDKREPGSSATASVAPSSTPSTPATSGSTSTPSRTTGNR